MDKENDINREFYRLLFGIRRSIRYHSRRVEFFQFCHSSVLFIALVLSSATALSIVNEISEWAPIAMSFAVTVVTSLSLVLRFNDKAWEHKNFVRRFTELEVQLTNADENNMALLVKSATTKRLEIEAEEPPVLRVLDTLMHNEMLRVMGYPKEQWIKVGFWQRQCANLFDLGVHEIGAGPDEKKLS